MIEKLVERDELLTDTPFLRRIREESREEGREEGRQEGVETGRREGLLNAILDIVALRFDPPISSYRQIEKKLSTITRNSELEKLFVPAVQGESLADFNAILQKSDVSKE